MRGELARNGVVAIFHYSAGTGESGASCQPDWVITDPTIGEQGGVSLEFALDFFRLVRLGTEAVDQEPSQCVVTGPNLTGAQL
jgi:hypothetical protein